jgi:hypothetical protein
MDDLIERLRAASAAMRSHYAVGAIELIPTWTMDEAAAELRTLRAELERRKYDVHTCHAKCQREACVLRREVDALRAERDAALAGVSEKCRHTSDRNRAATALKGSTDAACGTLGDSDGDDGA